MTTDTTHAGPDETAEEVTDVFTGEPQSKWESATEKPFLYIGLLFLVVYAYPIISPGLPAVQKDFCKTAQDVIWVLFIIDYVVRLAGAKHKFAWFKSHLLDFATVTLPVIRPLRAIRALLGIVMVVNKSARTSNKNKFVTLIGTTALSTFIVGALAITDAERGAPGASIHSFVDGLWWAFCTMTVMPYGEVFPTTPEGRMISVAVICIGLVIFGTITGLIGSYFMEKIEAGNDEMQQDVADIEVLLETQAATLNQIMAELSALKAKNN